MANTPNLDLVKEVLGNTSWKTDEDNNKDKIDAPFDPATGHVHDGTTPGSGPNLPTTAITGLAEFIRDTIGAALVAGTRVTVTVNDAGDTITISSDDASTAEFVRDTIGTALVAGSGASVTVNDAGDTITIASTITQYTDEMVDDRVAALLVAGTNITLTYNDGANTLTIASSGGGSGVPWFIVTAVAYGATGDGTTDDTAAINLAIAAYNAAGGGVLYFPHPSVAYKTSGGLTALTAPGIVCGDGKGDLFGGNAGSEVRCTSATAVLFTVSSYVLFRGIALKNTAGTTPSAGAGIRITHASDSFVRADLDSVSVFGFYDDVDYVTGYAWSIRDSFIVAPVRYGVRARNTLYEDAGDWAISDCYFASRTYNCTALLRLETGGGAKLENCKFNTALTAAEVIAGGYARHIRCIDLDASGAATGTTILLVSNCSMENYSTNAIRVQGPHWDQIVITGGQIGQYSNTGNRAIVIDTVSDVLITDLVLRAAASVSGAAISLNVVTNYFIGPMRNNGFGSILSATTSTGVDRSDGGAASSHTHPSTDITDFTEASQDVIGAMVTAAGGSYNDGAGTITLPSGGHVIENDAGSAMTQRANLQLKVGSSGATLTDDSGGNRTILDLSSLTGGGGSGSAAAILVDYKETTDIHSGTALAADTFHDVGTAQTFTLSATTDVLIGTGGALSITISGGGANLGVAQISLTDGVTTYTRHISTIRVTASDLLLPLGAAFLFNDLPAGSYTLKVRAKSLSAGTMDLKVATSGGYHGLSIGVEMAGGGSSGNGIGGKIYLANNFS